MADQETERTRKTNQAEDLASLGDEIVSLLSERTANPSEAFVLLQRLSILLWYQYKIDWHEKGDKNAESTRKQRYMDFVSELIDILLAENETDKRENRRFEAGNEKK